MTSDSEPDGDHATPLKPHRAPGSTPRATVPCATVAADVSIPERTRVIRRATARLCRDLGWSALHEVSLPDGRRADLLALRPDGGLVVVEVKSCARDFLCDQKWPDYRAHCDALFFAVDPDFPHRLLPDGPGRIVACAEGAEIVLDAAAHVLAPARRRALLLRFAQLAVARLAGHEDPEGVAAARMALAAE